MANEWNWKQEKVFVKHATFFYFPYSDKKMCSLLLQKASSGTERDVYFRIALFI